MLGVINLDKPVGPTSHDMVALVRRLSGIRRVGHAGTLDPLASGVLPILVGAATRVSEDLTGGPKRYTAVIRLGVRSETDDAQGPLIAGGPLPSREAVEMTLMTFVGTFDQRPPAFSARKQAGEVAYRAARAGRPLDLPARRVTIDAIDLGTVTPVDGHLDVEIDVRCGPGTYIRSLARDLGEALGCGGYLLALRRTEAAGLSEADAVPPAVLEQLADGGRLEDVIQPLAPLLPYPQVDLADAQASTFRLGQPVAISEALVGRVAVTSRGHLVGIGDARTAFIQPVKVLAP